MQDPITIFWFRRDLRLHDNHALYRALADSGNVQPLFIFDDDILYKLEKNDRRVEFIHKALLYLEHQLEQHGNSLQVHKGKPLEVFRQLISKNSIKAVYINHDYEPYAIKRDEAIKTLLHDSGIPFHSCKDQVIFEKNEVVKDDGKPYTVFTPYSRKWRRLFEENGITTFNTEKYLSDLAKVDPYPFLSLGEIGFSSQGIGFHLPAVDVDLLRNYKAHRNIPSLEATSRLGVHLRFGTISIRELMKQALKHSDTFLNELIWREFFMMILWHFPRVVNSSFKHAYDNIKWRNNEEEFEKWCNGETGYPLVDAGMRELKQAGFMHNRVRMVAASFLCKHLLIDWRWGEAWFASQLMDYELASNNGNWQWAAGSGCDAVPYFRIFNPAEQLKKFDPDHKYILKWLPEFGTSKYPAPMVDHRIARERALKVYKEGIA